MLGAPFSSEMSCTFSSFWCLFLPALCLSGFVCLPAVADCGWKIKVPYVENPELWNFLPLKPGVGQSIAVHASPTARKVSRVLSDILMTSLSVHHVFQNCLIFFKKCTKISWQWQIMKSRLQIWSKLCRLISAFYLLLVWLWVKTCHKGVIFPLNYFIFKTVSADSFFSQFKEPALKVHQMSFI